MKVALYFFLILGCSFSWAQNTVLTKQSFLDQVKKNHPVAFAANLIQLKAEAQLLQAKGAFDPKIYAQQSQKFYNQSQYFNLLESGLTIPTASPIEGKIGWEQNTGSYLNPEHKTPKEGLGSIGVAVNVGKGLLIDARRASLRQAYLLRDIAPAQTQLVLIDLLAQAETDYWNWALTVEKVVLYLQAQFLAEQRLNMVREAFKQGDRPAIDTVEAYVQWQVRSLGWEQAKAEEQVARNIIESYCWTDGLSPVALKNETFPQPINSMQWPEYRNTDLINWVDNIHQHPALTSIDYEIKNQNIEIALKKESLKPEIKVQYHWLSQSNPLPGTFFNEGYKWGGSASFPLLLRTERGNIATSQIKRQEWEAKRAQKQNELRLKMETYFELSAILNRQFVLAQEQQKRYEQLFQAEQQRFSLGEGTIFLLNSRETKWVESQEKLLDQSYKLHKNNIALRVARGIMD